MALPSIPVDTDPEVFERLVERWKALTVADRVTLVNQINADVERLAVAGILADRPTLSDVEVRHELARRRYGDELADAAYRHLLP